MKILYLGTVCDLNNYEKMLADCKHKESVATIVFESALLSGLKQNEAEVDIVSFPMIPTFPRSKWLAWGNKKEDLACGYQCTWLKTLNLPIVKQFSRRFNGRHIIKKWLKENRNNDCVVLSYSIPPFMGADIIDLCKKYNAKSFAIVTDLLRDMYINAHDNRLITAMKNRYLSNAIKYQGAFDGYVYLTEAMCDVINPEKPFIIMEGIADISDSYEADGEKTSSSAIMYAGTLEEKFGLFKLLDAFESADLNDTELWIFGSGSSASDIMLRSQNNPQIKFFGHKDRKEILKYEKKAALLVNPRNVDDDFTKYSFPSKTIEYMLSGTPVLTTRLKGIPDEYFEYVFSCENSDIGSLKSGIEYVLSLSSAERELFGARARQFVIENKNADIQAKRVISFISEVLKS